MVQPGGESATLCGHGGTCGDTGGEQREADVMEGMVCARGGCKATGSAAAASEWVLRYNGRTSAAGAAEAAGSAAGLPLPVGGRDCCSLLSLSTRAAAAAGEADAELCSSEGEPAMPPAGTARGGAGGGVVSIGLTSCMGSVEGAALLMLDSLEGFRALLALGFGDFAGGMDRTCGGMPRARAASLSTCFAVCSLVWYRTTAIRWLEGSGRWISEFPCSLQWSARSREKCISAFRRHFGSRGRQQ